jgi:translation initiation factor IF-3
LQQQSSFQNKIRVNNFIRVPEVRVIQADGTNLGIMKIQDALKLARDQGLDLIEINPKSSPPVVRLQNFGQFKYEEKKKQSIQKKSQKFSEMKEITFRPNTDENDLNHKMETAKQFLIDGNKVKFTIRFRGREITHPQIGEEKMHFLIKELSAIANSSQIYLEGKLMTILFSPKQTQ